jgi:hypothetical protein
LFPDERFFFDRCSRACGESLDGGMLLLFELRPVNRFSSSISVSNTPIRSLCAATNTLTASRPTSNAHGVACHERNIPC